MKITVKASCLFSYNDYIFNASPTKNDKELSELHLIDNYKQEVLGRNNRLLSFDSTLTA
jgi:hypothetical protein